MSGPLLYSSSSLSLSESDVIAMIDIEFIYSVVLNLSYIKNITLVFRSFNFLFSFFKQGGTQFSSRVSFTSSSSSSSSPPSSSLSSSSFCA